MSSRKRTWRGWALLYADGDIVKLHRTRHPRWDVDDMLDAAGPVLFATRKAAQQYAEDFEGERPVRVRVEMD